MKNRKTSRMALPLALSLAATLSAQPAAPIPAFPGATGPGAIATGGRGGDVYHVTRLDADRDGVLPGSLQYGINSTPSTGRTIVFDVGGTIYLAGQTANDTIRYNKGEFTLAGQTAPGPGITIAGTGTKWVGTNVIARNITIIPNKQPVTYDAFSLQVKNSIFDHVSAIWFTDEGISISDRGETTTVQYANISEGLNYGGHSFGSIITTEMDGTRYSFNHNLYAHNGSRMPRIGAEIGQTGSVLDFTNNVLYNWSSTKVGYGGRNQPCSTNFINNYYINGVNNATTNLFVGDDEPADSAVTKVYESGNKLDRNRNGVIDGVPVSGRTYFREGLTLYTEPFFVQGTAGTHETADVALQRVVDFGGANWQRRSPIDARIMASVKAGSGANIAEVNGFPQLGEWEALLAQRPVNGVAPFNRSSDFDTDRDGMPDAWEIAHGTNPAVADNNADFDSDGYRNVEEYINDLGAWPAPSALVFTNTNATGRYAEIGNWGNVWQPSRFDSAQINTGTVVIDATGQHARNLSIASNSGDTAALSVNSGWLDVRENLAIGSGGSGSVTQTGGVLRAGSAITLGGASSSGNLTLSGGTLATGLLTKGTQGGNFSFTGGTLHANTVAFSLINAGGKLAPGSDLALQQMAAASMPDIDNALVPSLPRAGSTRVIGDLTLQSGSLEIDINSSSSFDKLTVDNALTLGGALNVTAGDGYVPSNGSRWLIATAASITGSFASITPGYGVEVIGNSLYLVALSTGGTGSTNVTVASDGSGQYARLQEALDAVPSNNATPYIIHIKPGTYSVETVDAQFMADSPKITLNGLGGNPANVVITGAFNSAAQPNDRHQHATLVVLGNDFTAMNVTFANTAGDNSGQALAIYSKADRLSFVNCRLLGWQDTLRAEYGRQYFENCYIEGDVDFIYGHATGYFKNCELFVKSNGYVTAPDTLTPAGDHRSKGFVFEGCTITGVPANSAYLGRPWNAGGLSVFLNTKIGPVIRAEGWSGNTSTTYFAEYRSTDLDGNLLNVTGRAAGSIQLTEAQIAPYSQTAWLSGPDNWIPASGATAPPAAPSNLVATAGEAQVSLTWTASQSAVSYSLKRAATSGGPYALVASVPGTSYTDTNLTNGTTYYYVVSAVNSSGESTDSSQANATPVESTPMPPPAPASIAATGGNGSVALSWPAAPGAVSYHVKRAPATGGPYITIGAPTGVSYSDSTVTNGTTYYYVVSAVNEDGESPDSTEASATPQLAIPPAPGGFIAIAGNTQAGLSWSAAHSASSYNVKRATVSGGPYTTIATVTGNNYMNTGLTNGTTYYYVVSAVNAAGESANSSQVSAIPFFTPPVDPTGGLRVDINHSSRNQPAQTEPGYTMWSTIQPSGNPGTTSTGLTPISQTFAVGSGQYVTVSFAQTQLSVDRGGTGIGSHWFAGALGAQGATKLVGDGIMVAPIGIATGGEIVMTLKGLSAGSHTLLTYHNGLDNPASGNSYGAMDVYFNGTKVSRVQPSIRAATNLVSGTAYFEFTVSGPEEVVTILFSADPNVPAVSRRNPVINGFEIDVENIRQAGTPSPAHNASDVVTESGALALGWDAALAGNAVSRDVYFGTDPLLVKTATRTSAEFKGTQAARTYPLTALTGGTTYYWRIDEIDALGNITRGAVWQFATAQAAAGQSYADWAAASGLPESGQAPADDPDGDGVPNQLEFILGLNPIAPDSNGLPAIAMDADWVTFRFTRSTTVAGAFAVESSTDLLNWSVVPTTVESSTATAETLVAKVARIPGRLFLRLVSESVPTVPLGYLDTNLPMGNKAFGLLFDDTSATPAGVRAGRIETVSGDTIGLTGANWSAGLTNPAAPWALRFTSGAAEGRLVDITASTASTLSLGGLHLAMLGVAPGDRFELVALDTLGTLFGSNTLQGGTSAASADVVQLRSGAAWIPYYYDTTLGFWRRTSGVAVNGNNTVVRPGSGILILRRGAPLGLTISGRVLGSSFRQPVNNASSTVITAGFPTDTTLGDLAVQTLLPGWRNGTVASVADAVGLHNGTTWVPYYFNGVNWQTAAGVNASATAIPAGSALLIQRPGSTAGTTDLVLEKTY